MEWKHHWLPRDKLTLTIHKGVPLQVVSRLGRQLRACSQSCNHSSAQHQQCFFFPLSCLQLGWGAYNFPENTPAVISGYIRFLMVACSAVQSQAYWSCQHPDVHEAEETSEACWWDGHPFPEVFSCTSQVRSHQELLLLKHSSVLWKWKLYRGANENAFSDPENQSLCS